MQTTQLAHGKITNADHLPIELREPDDAPATMRMIWPAHPKRLNSTINAAMAILAWASTRHAAILAKRL